MNTTTESTTKYTEQSAHDHIDLVLAFDDLFTDVIEYADTSCLIDALAEAAADFVEDFDAFVGNGTADARIAELEAANQRQQAALTLLTNGFKYSTEVTTIARNALLPSSESFTPPQAA